VTSEVQNATNIVRREGWLGSFNHETKSLRIGGTANATPFPTTGTTATMVATSAMASKLGQFIPPPPFPARSYPDSLYPIKDIIGYMAARP
jgi:hypothetical protein